MSGRIVEAWVDLDGARVRTLNNSPDARGRTQVVVVPGLGALQYVIPTVRELSRRNVSCALLDLPGFGSAAPLPGAPTVDGVARLTADYLRRRPQDLPATLVGHSTGAQAALRAALMVQDDHPVDALILAGPAVSPDQRNLARLATHALVAFRRDSPGELRVLKEYWRGRHHVARMLQSAMADRPELAIAHVRTRVTITAGRRDSFAPAWWLETLAACAVRARTTEVVVLPGSHNNPYTHPGEFADVVGVAHTTTTGGGGRWRPPARREPDRDG